MRRFRLIRHRRLGRKKLTQSFDLQLTSLMDALVIILIFLLKTFQATTHQFSSVKGIELPVSQSEDLPASSLQVIVTPNGLTFEDKKILSFNVEAQFYPQDLDEKGLRILPLYNALMRAKQKSEILRAKSHARDSRGKPLPFEGVLAIQADKRVEYNVMKKILYTAGAANYRVFRFLALSK